MKVTNNTWIWDKNLFGLSVKRNKMIYIKTKMAVMSYKNWAEYLADNINRVKR